MTEVDVQSNSEYRQFGYGFQGLFGNTSISLYPILWLQIWRGGGDGSIQVRHCSMHFIYNLDYYEFVAHLKHGLSPLSNILFSYGLSGESELYLNPAIFPPNDHVSVSTNAGRTFFKCWTHRRSERTLKCRILL